MCFIPDKGLWMTTCVSIHLSFVKLLVYSRLPLSMMWKELLERKGQTLQSCQVFKVLHPQGNFSSKSWLKGLDLGAGEMAQLVKCLPCVGPEEPQHWGQDLGIPGAHGSACLDTGVSFRFREKSLVQEWRHGVTEMSNTDCWPLHRCPYIHTRLN